MSQPEHPRSILSITGADAAKFLQNLITNDLSPTGLTYTALLTPQGKYLADFFVAPQEDGFLIDVATSIAAGLFQRLSIYRLRSDVNIAESTKTVTCGLGLPPKGAFADPRHNALGWRSYEGHEAEAVDWADIRVRHLIPETGIELTPDTYILEAGFEELKGVDFKKGCYVGQEVTARMKHKTELKKGLMQVKIDGTAEVGTPIMRADKTIGTLFTQSGGLAIAYLRKDRIGPDMIAGTAAISV